MANSYGYSFDLFVFFFLSLNIGKVSVTFADMIAILLEKMNLGHGFSADIAAQKQTVFGMCVCPGLFWPAL